MITEDYVSFEVAKLLKDKGFHEPCIATYNSTTKNFQVEEIYEDWTIHWKDYISAPTLQMAMKWLRVVHNIHVTIYPYGEYSCNNYQFDVYKDNNLVVSKDDGYITPEQACEAAIKYCIENLIWRSYGKIVNFVCGKSYT